MEMTFTPNLQPRSSMEMISTPRFSPPSSKRASLDMSTFRHSVHALSPIQEVASDSDSDDDAIRKLKGLVEHPSGHTRSGTRDTIDSIVTGYSSMPASSPPQLRKEHISAEQDKHVRVVMRTPKVQLPIFRTPTRIPKLKGLSRSTASSDLRGNYGYSSRDRSSYADHYEDTPWSGSYERTHDTPPSSPPYMGFSSPTSPCPTTHNIKSAEDDEDVRSYELDFFKKRSISTLLTPDCLSSAPPSECEGQDSEPEPKTFDGIGVLLRNLDSLQDELDDFIAEYDASLRATKASQYVVSQLPLAPKTDNLVDQQVVPGGDMPVTKVATVMNALAERRDPERSTDESDMSTEYDADANAGFLEWLEEHETSELVIQVAIGMTLGMVWLAERSN
jgi:hypothetical protein